VGILATFVVVGNYAQVRSVEDKFDKKINEIEDGFQKNADLTKENIDFMTVLFMAPLLSEKSRKLFLSGQRVDLIQLLQEELPYQEKAKIKKAVDFYFKIKHNIDPEKSE
jgi:hypothetical protein